MGITKEDDKEDKDAEDNMDHRENQKFADHMKVDQVTTLAFNNELVLSPNRDGQMAFN